jgi:hypothetical protein
LVLTITYQASSDFSLSTQNSAYTNVGAAVHFGSATLPGLHGKALAFLDEPPANRASASASGGMTEILIYPDHVSLTDFTPATEQKSQTFTTRIGSLPPSFDGAMVTFCLAFPPGTGSVTITKISLASGSGASH